MIRPHSLYSNKGYEMRLIVLVLLFTILLCTACATPAQAERLFTWGAEFNSITNVLSGISVCNDTPVVDTTADRSGTYGLHIGSSALTSGTVRGCRANINNAAEGTTGLNWFIRAYVRFVTLPSATTSTFLSVNQNGFTTRVVRVVADNSGNITVFDEDGQVGSACNTTVSTGTWYRFELHVDNGADTTTADDDVELQIDGSAQSNCSATNRDLDTGYSNIFVGGNGAAEAQTAGEWYIDDVGVNNTTGSAQTSWPGSGAVGLAFVDADGSMANAGSQGTDWDTCTSNSAPCTTGTGGTAFQSIDEVGLTDSGSTTVILITQSTGTTDAPILQFSTQTLTSTGTSLGTAIDSDDTITFLGVKYVGHGGHTGTKEATLRLVSSGVIVENTESNTASTTYTMNIATAGTALFSLYAYTDPNTSAAWTLSAADAVEIGVRNTTVGGPAVAVHISQMTLDYEFVAVAGGAQPTPALSLLGAGR